LEGDKMDTALTNFTGILSNYYDVLTNSWIVLLLLSLFFVFFSKLSSKVTVFLLGMYISYAVLIPYLLKVSQINSFLDQYSQFSVFIYLAVSLIVGVIFYNLMKIAAAVIGFAAGGLLGYSLGNLAISVNTEWFKNLNFDVAYIPWIAAVVLGIIIALIVNKDFEKIIATLSIFFGSILLAFYTFFIVEKFSGADISGNMLINDPSNLSNFETYGLVGAFLVYMVIGFALMFRKKKN